MVDPSKTVPPMPKLIQMDMTGIFERMIIELCILGIAKKSFGSEIPGRE
jgi:hypothetical protein